MFPPGFAEIALVLFGLCVGSFLNVCIYRLPIGGSVVHPASRCPGCGQPLRLVGQHSGPELRWRCAAAAGPAALPISLRYPIVEALTAAIFLLHWYVVRSDAAAVRPARCSPAR